MDERRWPFVVFIALLVAAHFLLRIGFGFTDWAPDLLTVGLLLAVRRMRAGWAAGLGLLLGLLHDAVNLTTFGVDIVAMTLVGYVGSRSRDYFVGDSFFFLAVYLLLGVWLRAALISVLPAVTGLDVTLEPLLLAAPIAAAYSTAVGLICFGLYRTVARER